MVGADSSLRRGPARRRRPRSTPASRIGLVLALPLLFLAAGCLTPATDEVEAAPGEPLPGLSPDETRRFLEGRTAFLRAFSPEEGLGPLFNQARCSSCHDLPAPGGFGAEPVRKISAYDSIRGCSLLPEHGGSLLQSSVTPAGAAAGLGPERFPPFRVGSTELMPPPVYGLGLVDAIPRGAIAVGADPEDADGDGISGRVGSPGAGTVGVFGMKANHATLAGFIEDATRGEMGLTTPGLPEEELPGGEPMPEGADPATDPEVDGAFLAALTDYITFLAPTPPSVPEDREGRAAVSRGSQLFDALGCTSCHTPNWTTGPHPSPALDRRTFRAYSDFLLHDMGPELGDICGAGTTPSEWRTPRLAGLNLRRVFLHDGRAQSLASAIQLHGGEADTARQRFLRMDEASKVDLIRFLRTL